MTCIPIKLLIDYNNMRIGGTMTIYGHDIAKLTREELEAMLWAVKCSNDRKLTEAEDFPVR